jgi:hypothetical protein
MGANGFTQWAAESANYQLVFRLFDFSYPSKSRKHARCAVRSLPQRAGQRRLLLRQTLANIAEKDLEVVGGHSLAERIHQAGQHREIGLGKAPFGRSRKLVQHGRPSAAWPGGSLVHDAVALQRGEMGSHGVIRDPENLAKVLDRATASTQLCDDLPSRCVEKSSVEVHR